MPKSIGSALSQSSLRRSDSPTSCGSILPSHGVEGAEACVVMMLVKAGQWLERGHSRLHIGEVRCVRVPGEGGEITLGRHGDEYTSSIL